MSYNSYNELLLAMMATYSYYSHNSSNELLTAINDSLLLL